MINKKVLSTAFIVTMLLLPVFSQYSFGAIDLDLIMVGIVVFMLLVTKQFNIKPIASVVTLVVYTIMTTLINLLIGKLYATSLEIILRLAKYIVYLTISLLVGLNGIFEYKKAMRIYRVIVYIAIMYLFAQAFFYYAFGVTLPNKIGGSSTNITGEEIGRLRSFYSEPAAFAYSMIPFLVCSLFGSNYMEKDTQIRDAIFVSVGIVISTSGQGIITCACVWVLWVFVQVLTGKMSGRVFGTIFLIAILCVGLYSSGILSFALDRVGDTSENGAIAARFSGYKTFSLLKPVQLVFGTGYGNYVTKNVYGLDVPYEFVNYSSIAEHIFCMGIIGFGILVLMFAEAFKNGSKRSRALIFAVAIVALFGCPLIVINLPSYLLFIFVSESKGKDEIDKKKENLRRDDFAEGK